MKITVKVEGLQELDDALTELPKRTAKNVLRRALVKASEPMIQAAKGFARYKTGELRKNIVPSKIKFMSGKSQAFKEAFAAVSKAGGTTLEARTAGAEAAADAPDGMTSAMLIWGPTREVWYGYIHEFGSVKMSPKPFMRPAWDANKRDAGEVIRTVLSDEIEKAAQRIAKKAAK